MINWASASDLDRVDHHRQSDEWVSGLWRADDAKLLTLDATSKFTTNAGGSKLRMKKPFVEYDNQRHRLLGLLNGAPIFSVQCLTEGEMHDLREVGENLSDHERDIAAAATHIANWHREEPFCPRCGKPSTVVNGGFARRCKACDSEYFPRTDPAVIVAIVDSDDRLLLGRQPSWANRVSVMAGFVEAGESLEHAIHREMGEEVDLTLTEFQYFGSQPWPFPRSLMVAFSALATSTTFCLGDDDISYADWFTRDRVKADLESGEISLPTRSSIAYRMVDAWLHKKLRS